MTAIQALHTNTANSNENKHCGLVVVLKKECPTCQLVLPALQQMADQGIAFTIITQDHGDFPALALQEHASVRTVFDESLRESHHLEVEIVPTLFLLSSQQPTRTVIGWERTGWRELTGLRDLGNALPAARPGCGALNLEPEHQTRLELECTHFGSRTVEIGDQEDPFEATFARGWTDGLPVVPPTPSRVVRMLSGTTRDPGQIVATIAPDFVSCTVEKVAINAVMAGCLPEYLPVVLAAVEAACDPAFNWHGLAATTYFSGPVVVVNGPIVEQLNLNSGINALGQGNRANLTIGRALNLTLRNIGGARPGGIDRATLGNPGKLSFCIAENERDSPWTSLAESRGLASGTSAVTLFAGEGPRGIVDQLSRTPESLARSFASALLCVAHPKIILGFDALLVVSPEHARVFKKADWSREHLTQHLHGLLQRPASELVRGAAGCAEGIPEKMASAELLPKFQRDGLLLLHAGGEAGLFSAVIGGWVNGATGSAPVTKPVCLP